MFIENCALYEIQQGTHSYPGENSFLIQIVDPDMDFPIPRFDFKVIKQYKFLDLDDNINDSRSINETQAKFIANDLKYALENKMNVIVHCVMGVCRSGAVAEVGTMIGFEDTGKWRQPNLRVKRFLMKHLDLLPYG
jgi:predicted protein tyrosine phosphatase